LAIYKKLEKHNLKLLSLMFRQYRLGCQDKSQGQAQFTKSAKAEFAQSADGWLVAYAWSKDVS
jgi:hypothetical protein